MKIMQLKPTQAIAIGPNIHIQLIETNGQHARLVIHAPKHLKILRDDAKKKS